jgi:hypothetical protein
MKKIYSLLLTLFISNNIFSQNCILQSCDTTINFSGTLNTIGGVSNYYKAVCIKAIGNNFDNTVITTASNWNNWQNKALSIYADNTNLEVKQNINLSNDRSSLYLHHNNNSSLIISQVSMDGDDSIFVSSNVRINTLISNNSIDNTTKVNRIFLNDERDSTYFNGSYHKYGDTVRTAGGTGNKVVITSCKGTALFIDLLYFRLINNEYLEWEINSNENYTVHLEASNDSKNWYEIYNSNFIYFKFDNLNNLFYRLKIVDKLNNIKFSKILNKFEKSSENENITLYEITENNSVKQINLPCKNCVMKIIRNSK